MGCTGVHGDAWVCMGVGGSNWGGCRSVHAGVDWGPLCVRKRWRRSARVERHLVIIAWSAG